MPGPYSRLPCLLLAAACVGVCGCGAAEDTVPDKAGADKAEPTQVTTRGGAPAADGETLEDAARKLPSSGVEKMDGLEALKWDVQAAGNPARLARISLGSGAAAPAGPYRLALELLGGEAEQTIVRCEGAWRLSTARGARSLLVIYNDTGAPLPVSLAYSLSDKFVWYEAPAGVLKPGWNTVVVEQDGSQFRTRSSGMQPTAALWRPEDCRAVSLVIPNGRRAGRLFLEYLALDLQPEPRQ